MGMEVDIEEMDEEDESRLYTPLLIEVSSEGKILAVNNLLPPTRNDPFYFNTIIDTDGLGFLHVFGPAYTIDTPTVTLTICEDDQVLPAVESDNEEGLDSFIVHGKLSSILCYDEGGDKTKQELQREEVGYEEGPDDEYDGHVGGRERKE